MKNLMLVIFVMPFLYACSDDQIIPVTPDCSVTGAGDIRSAPESIFVFSGQSNMQGQASTDQLYVEYKNPIQNVVIWSKDHWETYQPGQGTFGPDVSFLHAWSIEHPNETIGIMKCAIGATSITDWDPNYSPMFAVNPQYGSLYKHLIDVYKAAGSLPVKGFIWSQGESDSMDSDLMRGYFNRLQSFIAHIRIDMVGDNGIIPFIIGETKYPEAKYISVIQESQQYAADMISLVCKSETDYLTLNSDNLHFDAIGQIGFGEGLYSTWKECI